ncbi:MAG: hypothetical protein LBK55_01790 [Azoarcus sp.]|nr:hypothetical protein [Azoarcus sp.]
MKPAFCFKSRKKRRRKSARSWRVLWEIAAISSTIRRTLSSDIGILGAPSARFAEYEGQIRREYAFVPDDVYNARRSAVLEHFAARDPLFRTVHFHNELGGAGV